MLLAAAQTARNATHDDIPGCPMLNQLSSLCGCLNVAHTLEKDCYDSILGRAIVGHDDALIVCSRVANYHLLQCREVLQYRSEFLRQCGDNCEVHGRGINLTRELGCCLRF